MANPNWDLAQIVISVFAIVATIAIATPLATLIRNLFRKFSLKVRRRFRPNDFVCGRLEWRDIPEGPLHECTIPKENCQHIIATPSSIEDKWEPFIPVFFKWIKRGNIVRKPEELELGTKYIPTDPMTLKAIHILVPVLAERKPKPAARVVFQKSGSLDVGYITTSSEHTHHLSFDMILDGYSPWYTQELRLVNKKSIPNPIKKIDEVSRGGWLIAIGLSPTLPVQKECMKRGARVGLRRLRPTVDDDFKRLRKSLRNVKKAFPDEVKVREALSLVRMCSEGGKSSAFHHLLRESELTQDFDAFDLDGDAPWIHSRQYATGLSKEECGIAKGAFNRYSDKLNVERQVIKLNLGPVLAAVVVGSYAVCMYFQRAERLSQPKKSDSWKKLERMDNPVYFRARTSEEILD